MKRVFAQIFTQKQFILLLFFIPPGLKTNWIKESKVQNWLITIEYSVSSFNLRTVGLAYLGQVSVKEDKKNTNKLQEPKNREELSRNEQRHYSIDSSHFLRSKDSVFEHHTKFLYRL